MIKIVKKIRSAFTMIELIFVVVILGIIGLMSSDIIFRTYENYAFHRDISDLQSRSKQVLDQISKYLDNSLKSSIAQYNSATPVHRAISEIDFANGDVNITNNRFLEWIGKDIESMRGIWSDGENRVYPGYSGFANVRDSNATDIVTTDCNLSYIEPVQNAITAQPLALAAGGQRTAIYFVYANSVGTVAQRFWDNNGSSLFPVSGFTPDTGIITLSEPPGEISENYYLTYSAYGVQLDNAGNLFLYWNFRPWNGDSINNDAQQRLLMQDVTEFKSWGQSDGSVIRLRVCLSVDISDPDAPEFCKEAMILR